MLTGPNAWREADRYEAPGGLVRVNGQKLEPPAKPAKAPALAPAVGAIVQDPILERERALIGGAILCELSWADIDDHVKHIDHRRIVDALAPHVPYGLTSAMALDVGLPVELRGGFRGETPVGYLAGCVRVYRESMDTVARGR